MILYIIISIILLIVLFFNKKYIEGFNNNIIGYIHVCQKGDWKRSFNILMNAIKKSKLYDNTNEIRIGIVNESGKLIEDSILNDSKFKLIYIGNDKEYERPTLLHMKNAKDPDNTLYYYLHTKGIRHFNTEREEIVINWINNMLDCNVVNWRKVVEKLQQYETYGCNYNNKHYSGNFWWATRKHIDKLTNYIEDYYTAPEDWILMNKDNMYCDNNCGDKYIALYPDDFY